MGAAPRGTGTAAQPAGHRPVAVGGWLRMSCRMSGDPRWRGCGMVAAWSGPSGVRWLVQLATASAMPAVASMLARADGRRGGLWYGMSWVFLSSGGVTLAENLPHPQPEART